MTSMNEMLRDGLFRFVAGNVSLGPEGELIVTDGRFLAGVDLKDWDDTRRELALKNEELEQQTRARALERHLVADWMRRAEQAERELSQLKANFILIAQACGNEDISTAHHAVRARVSELNEHKENAIKATGLLVEARRDFVLVADALGLVSTDDTGRIGAVAPVEEVVKEARLAASALAKQAELFESLSMACETPPEGCDCAGCSYAREKGGDHNT
jgi:hypothetical protein